MPVFSIVLPGAVVYASAVWVSIENNINIYDLNHCKLSYWGRVTHICVTQTSTAHWFKQYLNQCWDISNWTPPPPPPPPPPPSPHTPHTPIPHTPTPLAKQSSEISIGIHKFPFKCIWMCCLQILPTFQRVNGPYKYRRIMSWKGQIMLCILYVTSALHTNNDLRLKTKQCENHTH